MKHTVCPEELFERAQKSLLSVVQARTRKKLPFKRLRAVNDNIRLEYLLSLVNQAELWLDYRTQLKSVLSFTDANLFNGTLYEHCLAILKACDTMNPVILNRRPLKRGSSPIEHSVGMPSLAISDA
ncbi:MAG: hypothetical protein H0X66_14690 [Verrucomicrobia bacterium]|nr:hypothetical protein [Verrucomicrobiota bacterium]